MVYNKTSERLQSPCKKNPKDVWIRKPYAFEGVVEPELFAAANQLFEARALEYQEKYGDVGMVEKLRTLHDRYGFVTPGLVGAEADMAAPATYRKHFESLDAAYQRVFVDVRNNVKTAIVGELRNRAGRLDEYDDYVVLDQCLSILVQPSVPAPLGYQEYWSFRPDPRIEVDITLGVPLSNDGKYTILGYLAFPRLLVRNTRIRLFTSSIPTLELYGYRGMDMIWELVDERRP